MKKSCLIFCYFALTITHSLSQDTFSIVALDTATGEVGSAGASCIAGSIIISDVHPGRGAIHTQAWWRAVNQNNAKNLMDTSSFSPQEIINWLVANDDQGNPTLRQYGIVDFDSLGNPRSVGYTGVNTNDWKGHINGFNYSIQGNILLGPQILDSIEARFINTPGDLACKLMSALQGANVPGADTRCLADGTSSISAFIRVADQNSIYLDLNVNNTLTGVEPIDTLQKLFDDVKTCCNLSVFLTVDTASPGINDGAIDIIIITGGVAPYSYLWSNGATTEDIDSLAAGPYSVVATDITGCTVSADITVPSTTGLPERLHDPKIELFPNPTSGQLTLNVSNSRSNLSIELHQIDGQLIYTKDLLNLQDDLVNLTIDLSKYAKGMYYLQIVTDESVITRKVIYQ